MTVYEYTKNPEATNVSSLQDSHREVIFSQIMFRGTRTAWCVPAVTNTARATQFHDCYREAVAVF
jgi:hypothetical protein